MDQILREAEAKTGERLLRYFRHEHLRDVNMRAYAEQAAAMAVYTVTAVKPGPERTVCLRKLLECKDAGVRAMLPDEM